MRKSYIIVIVIVVIALLGGGVWFFTKKSDDDAGTKTAASSANSSELATGSTETSLAGTDTAGTADDTVAAEVSIVNMTFAPSNVTVKKGSMVKWTNKDSMAHTVTESDTKNGPNSGTLNKGDTYSFTYSAVGTYSYRCDFHPNMTGTVTVTE